MTGAADERTSPRASAPSARAVYFERTLPDATAGVHALLEPDGGGPALGASWRGNPLREPWTPPAGPGSLLLGWSGTLADEPFAAHPATWLRTGHEALAAHCERVAAELDRVGRRLCFQPHARHVLSDPQSCRAFLRDRADEPFDVALAPASMLEPSMLPDLDDHLRRAFETLGPVAAVVVLEDDVPGTAPLPADRVTELMDAHVPASTPVVRRAATPRPA
ncbi:MAG: hypothetical protein ACYTJ0_07410 [Planctomycetota bacterium]